MMSVASRQLHQAVKMICRPKGPCPGKRLKGPDGTILIDGEAVSAQWMQRWMQHFHTGEVACPSFEDRCTLILDEGVRDTEGTHELSADMGQAIPHLIGDDIRRAIKAQPRHKATPDIIPAEAWHMIADIAATPLASFFNSLYQRKAIPTAYAGAQIVAIWKKKGSILVPDQFRPISLMKFESKLWSRIILDQLVRRLRHHRGQFGSGIAVGVNFPQLLVRQLAGLAQAEKIPSVT
eukprot:2438634-Amphidinium_carterae.1